MPYIVSLDASTSAWVRPIFWISAAFSASEPPSASSLASAADHSSMRFCSAPIWSGPSGCHALLSAPPASASIVFISASSPAFCAWW